MSDKEAVLAKRGGGMHVYLWPRRDAGWMIWDDKACRSIGAGDTPALAWKAAREYSETAASSSKEGGTR